MENLHKDINHQGYKKLKSRINEMKIYYKGINNDLEKIQDLCEVCIQKKAVFYKREPSKQIIMERPKQRYVIDLTYLPIEIIKETEFKYLFNIIDHFSKFIISFLLFDKKADSIVSKLKLCFDKYGYPEQLSCYNGSEFINNKVKKLLDDKKITMIRGMPYNPHSQGIIERTHRTVRNALICDYLNNKKF